MKCIHLNIRGAFFLILSVLLNGIKQSQMADNNMDMTPNKDDTYKISNNISDNIMNPVSDSDGKPIPCRSNVNCTELQFPCIHCEISKDCKYGEEKNVMCYSKSELKCNGKKQFERSFICRYCYQTEPWEHTCDLKANCNSVASPRHYYKTNCSVKDDVICLGKRKFPKKVLCNWTGGYRWSTALILSVTLGGFGADRFYLGHWQEGIGKLFSFGGLGVWTLIDVILISLHYLGPADGSLYL